MTRKHFIVLAKNIALIEDEQARRLACFAVVEACYEFNGKFDVSKFKNACGVK